MYMSIESQAAPVAALEPPQDEEGALAWLRSRWASFEDLSRRIIDLQHRAAVASQTFEERGEATKAAAARMIIEELAKLQRVHHRILTWAEGSVSALGLGAVQIPLGIAGVTVVALLVSWAFRKFAIQERALDLLEEGSLTPEEFRELDILDPPGIGEEIGGVLGNVGWWALLIIGGLVLLEFSKRGSFLPNPPVVLFGNPPGPMSQEVGGVWYQHLEDGEWYIHHFEGEVEMEALEDGTVLLSHPSREIWREF